MKPPRWWPGHREQELDEEIAAHLRMAAADRVARGELAEDANAAARRQFGNVGLVKETTRDVWGFRWVEQTLRDVTYGLRNLRADRSFTAVAVLSLAIGIGANTAIFTLINALVLRSLPVSDPHRLAQVTRGDDDNCSSRVWEELQPAQDVFSRIFAWSSTRFDLAPGGERQPAQGLYVSGEYFEALGIRPAIGRMLSRSDDSPSGGARPLPAVLSHGFWQRQYASDRTVPGRTIRLDGHPFEIVGVTPPGFTGVEVGNSFDVAVPLITEPVINSIESWTRNRVGWWLHVMGRLRPDISPDQARARLQTISPRLFRSSAPTARTPNESGRPPHADRLDLRPAPTGLSAMRAQYGRVLLALLGMVGLVLLIACANLANLLLARARARRREIAVRLALGASRARLVRQLLTESLLLAIFGACLGMLIASWGSTALLTLLSSDRTPFFLDLTPDLRVLGFAAALSILTTLIFGFVPAMRATRLSVAGQLKQGDAHTATASGTSRLRHCVAGFQVAISVVLLSGAGLLVRTLHTLTSEDMGFTRDGVLLVEPGFRHGGYSPERQKVTGKEILQRLESLPGVEAASQLMVTPMSETSWQWDIHSEPSGGTRGAVHGYFNVVSPGYFQTLRTPLVAGRAFTAADDLGAARVAIVNETMARKLFPGENPLGRTYREPAPTGASVNEYVTQIVGMARDAKYRRLGAAMPPTIYLPIAQSENKATLFASYAVRFTGAVPDITARVRDAFRAVDPRLSIELRLLRSQVDDSIRQERVTAALSAGFGVVALILAAAGMYGLVAYGVERRRNEIGIRVALGATHRMVEWMVLREVGMMLLFGIAVGVPAALACTRVIRNMLYGVSAGDPATFAAAGFVLSGVAVLAAWIPARRAARMNPLDALRHD